MRLRICNLRRAADSLLCRYCFLPQRFRAAERALPVGAGILAGHRRALRRSHLRALGCPVFRAFGHAHSDPCCHSPSPVPAASTASALLLSSASGDLTAEELWPTTYPDNPRLTVSSVFDELQERNRDIIAWLKIDDELEEPVVQRDNVFYLTHNALQQESVTGALFLDENCDLIHVPTQMVIHGHNMKEGAMFGMLKKYKVKGAAFYREHAFIDFNTLYENGRYVIFAVAEIDIRPGQPHYLPFWHYSRFDSAEAFNRYVETARACSLYHCTVDVRARRPAAHAVHLHRHGRQPAPGGHGPQAARGRKPAGSEHGGHEHLRPLNAPLYKRQKLCYHTSQRL